jgi:hypothetical protein
MFIQLHDDDTESLLWTCLVLYRLTLGYVVWKLKIRDWKINFYGYVVMDMLKTKVKGKVVLRLGERSYSFYLFSTSELDGGEWSVSCFGRVLPLGKDPPVSIWQEAGRAPEPVWTQRLEEKSSTSVGDRTLVVQSLVRHYTDWATPEKKKVHNKNAGNFFKSVRGILWKWEMAKKGRICLFKSYYMPILMYGAETWTWTTARTCISRLTVAEMRWEEKLKVEYGGRETSK